MKFECYNFDKSKITIDLDTKNPIIITNTASFCGLTSCEISDLYTLCKKKPNLTIYCFPSNQFLQEDTSKDPRLFVIENFGEIPNNMIFMEFSNVNYFSRSCHSIFSYLIRETKIFGLPVPIKWNFEKFLIINGKIKRIIPTRKA